MSTWWWVLAWVLLVLGCAAYLASRAWGLWGQVRELIAEIAVAQERMEGVQGQLELLGEQVREPGQLAVFSSPERIRSEQTVAQRARHQLAASARSAR